MNERTPGTCTARWLRRRNKNDPKKEHPMQTEHLRVSAVLSIEDIQAAAREHAKKPGSHALQHPYTHGSPQAMAFERAFVAARIELDRPELV